MEAFMRLVHFSIKQHKKKFFFKCNQDRQRFVNTKTCNKNKNGIES